MVLACHHTVASACWQPSRTRFHSYWQPDKQIIKHLTECRFCLATLQQTICCNLIQESSMWHLSAQRAASQVFEILPILHPLQYSPQQRSLDPQPLASLCPSFGLCQKAALQASDALQGILIESVGTYSSAQISSCVYGFFVPLSRRHHEVNEDIRRCS